MKILLHICCAPCVMYPLERLKEQGHEVTGLFFNPNIHPFAEYAKRREAVEAFSKDSALKVAYPDYKPQEFFNAVNLKEELPERCFICWDLRLRKTAQSARDKGFDAFTTTLLVSPYQDQETLKKIGSEAADDFDVRFLYEDFRPGFRQAHNQAKEKGIYCQKYCGCIYSEIERCKKSQKR